MEFTRLSVFALFCLTLAGINASQSGEDYWKSIWPNTPMPKVLLDLLLPDSGKDIPIRGEENKQYWTVFFQHDLYPGNKISLRFHKNTDTQAQPFGGVIWYDGKPIQKSSHTFENFCEKPPAIGEEKHCALSLESMMNYAISKLGTNIKVISSSFAKNHDQYVVDEVNKIGDKAVMCHRLNFKNVIFYCHQVNATTAYMVPLVDLDGTKAKALTVCHHDTRGMNPDGLYDVLKVKPGTVPICHFVGNKAIAWVPDHVARE